jgi:hypothetical protein
LGVVVNTSSRWFFGSLVIVALTIADAACSSSSPLKKTSDAAVARDLGADEQLARDALPDLAGPDLAEPDLLVQVIPDASLAGKDTVLADLPAGKDTILVDLPAGRDAVLADLPAGKDTVLADLPVTVDDAPASDVPAGDGLLPADSVTRDGPTDGAFDCRSSSYPRCNDNMMAAHHHPVALGRGRRRVRRLWRCRRDGPSQGRGRDARLSRERHPVRGGLARDSVRICPHR